MLRNRATEESTDEIRERIHRKASARTDAMIYSLNNTYMTVPQKAKIEAVYQFPFGVMHYAFAYFAIWMKYPIWNAWIEASGVGLESVSKFMRTAPTCGS